MVCDIGNFLLLLGIILLPFQIVSGFKNQFWIERIRTVYVILISLAYLTLVYGFVSGNQSIVGVLLYSCPSHPWYYKIGATWSYHQGSMLVWCFLMGIVSVKLPKKSLGVLGIFQLYFLTLLYFKASPFLEMPNGNFQGRGINPLLEDSALLYHPPLLYMGYILIFGLASLLGSNEKIKKEWIIFSWGFLTLGLISGSFWAFYEVGWGGWWFWDAVENIALIPWLLLLGALHLSHKKNTLNFKILIFLSFAFSFLGVFTVRMGLIRSIHNFTQNFDNLWFLIVGVCLMFIPFGALLGAKKDALDKMSIPGGLSIIFTLLIGIATFFPLFSTFEVSNTYYQTIVAPLFTLYPLCLIFVMTTKEKVLFYLVPFLASLILIAIFIFHEKLDFIPFVLLMLISSILAIAIWVHKKDSLSVLAHTGFLIFLIGISFNHFLKHENNIELQEGAKTFFMGKEITLHQKMEIKKENYTSNTLHIKWDNQNLYPELRTYKNYDITRPKTDFALGLFTTYYIYIIDHTKDIWTVKAQYHPLISWIWIGAILMAVGGILSLRKRRKL